MSARFDTARARCQAAHVRLGEALAQPEDDFVRDALIQRFGFTFELGWKAMQAYLHALGTSVGAPRQAIREALAIGLLDAAGAESWLAAAPRHANRRQRARPMPLEIPSLPV